MDIKIVIAVNKKDVWFCRICVASIRYYYPDVEIYLLKDELNGRFSTREIEKYWKVKTIDYAQRHFGWSGAKIHFYCDARFENQHFLVLDSDIVFTGKLLDEAFVKSFNDDVIVCGETFEKPGSAWFSQTYFDYNLIKEFDPGYIYCGYTFNCGQLFCKGNFLSKDLIEPYFDFNNFPPWKRKDIFPMVDQSVFNYLLPNLAKEGTLKIGRENYMLWSETDKAKEIPLEFIKEGLGYPFLIHWAGALRIPYLSKMTQGKILGFFETFYYKPITMGFLLCYWRKFKPVIEYYLRKNYNKLRGSINLEKVKK